MARLPVAAIAYIVVKYHAGMDSVVRVHDNLEHFAPLYDRMRLADAFAVPGRTLDFVLGGLPRDMVGSELFVGVLAGAIFPLVWSLVVSEFITRGLAFYGMRRLLKATGLDTHWLVYLGIPTVFSILPFHHPVVGAVAGVPLLLSAVVALHRSPKRSDYAVLAVFPALSWAGATIAYVSLLVAYTAAVMVVRPAYRAVAKGAAVLSVAFLAIEWRLFYSLFAGPESHRVDIAEGANGVLSLSDLSGRVFSLGRRGLELLEKHAEHASTALIPASLLLIGVGVGVTLVRRRRPDAPSAVLLLALSSIAAVLVMSAVWPEVNARLIRPVVDLPHVQLDRIAWLVPGLAYLALAAGAAALLGAWPGRATTSIVALVLAVQAVAAWNLADFADPERPGVTISEFYATDTFVRVAQMIDDDWRTGRVVSVGFHPHVTVYNGFDAADGYWYNYPLEYKVRFRELIAPALDDDAGLESYFDSWGSRAYVFQPALGLPDCCTVVTYEPYELIINPGALSDLGVAHILSNGDVTNAGELGLELLGRVGAVGSYEISVYAVG